MAVTAERGQERLRRAVPAFTRTYVRARVTPRPPRATRQGASYTARRRHPRRARRSRFPGRRLARRPPLPHRFRLAPAAIHSRTRSRSLGHRDGLVEERGAGELLLLAGARRRPCLRSALRPHRQDVVARAGAQLTGAAQRRSSVTVDGRRPAAILRHRRGLPSLTRTHVRSTLEIRHAPNRRSATPRGRR